MQYWGLDTGSTATEAVSISAQNGRLSIRTWVKKLFKTEIY